MISFQSFINSCMESKIHNRDYFSELKKFNPSKDYFIEPDWGNVPLYKQAYYCACIQRLFPKSCPEWVNDPKYILKEPYFPMKDRTGMLNLLLMIESPIEFKIRNIFVSDNSLTEV